MAAVNTSEISFQTTKEAWAPRPPEQLIYLFYDFEAYSPLLSTCGVSLHYTDCFFQSLMPGSTTIATDKQWFCSFLHNVYSFFSDKITQEWSYNPQGEHFFNATNFGKLLYFDHHRGLIFNWLHFFEVLSSFQSEEEIKTSFRTQRTFIVPEALPPLSTWSSEERQSCGSFAEASFAELHAKEAQYFFISRFPSFILFIEEYTRYHHTLFHHHNDMPPSNPLSSNFDILEALLSNEDDVSESELLHQSTTEERKKQLSRNRPSTMNLILDLFVDHIHQLILFIDNEQVLKMETNVQSTKKETSMPSEISILMFAHNVGRFDLILLMPRLLNLVLNDLVADNIFAPDEAASAVHQLTNNGRILSFQIKHPRHNWSVQFKDSVPLMPTGAKSLRGACKSLKVPIQKMDLAFWSIDLVLELMWYLTLDVFVSSLNDFPTLSLYFFNNSQFNQRCIEKDNDDDQSFKVSPSLGHFFADFFSISSLPLTHFGFQTIDYQNEVNKFRFHAIPLFTTTPCGLLNVPSTDLGLDASIHLNIDLLDAINAVLMYSQTDSLALCALMKCLVQTILCPDYDNTDDDDASDKFLSPKSVLMYPSLSSVAYNWLVFSMSSAEIKRYPMSLGNNNDRVSNHVCIPRGGLEMALRLSCYGGRTYGTTIGQVKGPYALLEAQPDLRNRGLQVVENYFKFIKAAPENIFQLLTEEEQSYVNSTPKSNYANQTVLFLRWICQLRDPDVEACKLFLSSILIADIVSHYPSSLTNPLPYKFHIMTNNERQKFNQVFSIFVTNRISLLLEHYRSKSTVPLSSNFPLFKYPPLVGLVRFSRSYILHDIESTDCLSHLRLLCPAVPVHLNNVMPGALFWPGTALLGFGVYTSVDMANMMNDGWHVEIIDPKDIFHPDGKYFSEKELCLKFIQHKRKNLSSTNWSQQTLNFVGDFWAYTSEPFFRSAFAMKQEAAEKKETGKKTLAKLLLNSAYGASGLDCGRKTQNFAFRCDEIPEDTFSGHDGVSMRCSLSGVNEQDCGIELIQVDNKRLPFTHALMPENKKCVIISTFCLSYSRAILLNMRDNLQRCRFDNLDLPPAVYYQDTDSVIAPAHAFTHYPFQTVANANISRLVERPDHIPQFDYHLAFESGAGDFCPALSQPDEGIFLGCFFTKMITIAKKFYLLTCAFCGCSKKRSKGHRETDLLPRHFDQIYSFYQLVRKILKTFPPSLDLYKRFLKSDISPPACFLASSETNFSTHITSCDACKTAFCDYLPETIDVTTAYDFLNECSAFQFLEQASALPSDVSMFTSFNVKVMSASGNTYSVEPHTMTRRKKIVRNSPVCRNCRQCGLSLAPLITSSEHWRLLTTKPPV